MKLLIVCLLGLIPLMGCASTPHRVGARCGFAVAVEYKDIRVELTPQR